MNNNGTHKLENERIEMPDVDARMNAWLDRALIADDPPDELNGRVMTAVRRELAISANEAPAVAGRISPWRWTLRIAAVIAVAALLGVAYQLYVTDGTTNGAGEELPQIAADELEKSMENLEQLIPSDETAFDSQLAEEFDALEEDLDAFAARLEWSSDSFDAELDSLTDDLTDEL